MIFDLQRFADDSEGYTIDQALDVLNGTNESPASQEPAQEQPDTQQPETQTEQVQQPNNEPEEVEKEEPAEQQAEQEQPAIDYNISIPFKANGQESNITLAKLVELAQKGANYDKLTSDNSLKDQALKALMQQQSQTQQPDPVKTFEDIDAEVTARAMKKLNIIDPEDFWPDASGKIGNKAHFAAYQDALFEIRQEQQDKGYQQRQYDEAESEYVSYSQTVGQDKNINEILQSAINALYLLPQKGQEGRAEFEKLYPIYKKIEQRDAFVAMQNQGIRPNFGKPNLTKQEVGEIIKFFDSQKGEYYSKQQKETVKAQVPKSVPIKPTVKVESTGNNEPVPAKKIDFKKFQTMDLDEIAKKL